MKISCRIIVIAAQSNERRKRPRPTTWYRRRNRSYLQPGKMYSFPTQPTNPIMNTSKYITYAIASSFEVFHYLIESYIDALRVVARVPGLLPRRDRVEPRFLDLGHGGPATEAAAQVGTTLTVEDGQDH
jgi:hypothetical protein